MYWSSNDCALPGRRARAPPPRSRRRSPRARRATPGKNREMDAKPCAMVAARRRPQRERRAVAGQAVERTPSRPAPRTAHSCVAQVLLDQRDLGLHRELDVGRGACAGPRFGARRRSGSRPGRFWYIRPRVPSIGSTMITHCAAARSALSGHDASPPGKPSATSTTGRPRVAMVRAISSTSSLRRRGRRHRSCRLRRLGTTPESVVGAAACSHARTTSRRMRRCSSWMRREQRMRSDRHGSDVRQLCADQVGVDR